MYVVRSSIQTINRERYYSLLPITKLIRKPLEIFRRSEHDQRTLSHNEFYFDKTEVSQDVENVTLAKPNITIQYQKFFQ